MSKPRLWIVSAAIALALLSFASVFAVQALARSRLQKALGPHAHVAQFQLLTSQLAVSGVRVTKSDGWPLDDQLRVKNATVDLSLPALWSRSLPKLTIDGLYIAIVRGRDGSTRVLPDLTESEAEPAQDDSEPSSIRIDDLEIRDATIELVDDSTKQRARVRVSRVNGHLRDITLPALGTRTRVELSAVLPGPRTTGTLSIDGWITLASQDAKLTMKSRGLDLALFEPYLLQSANTGVERGWFDFRLTPSIVGRRLKAPGHIDVHQLKLAEAKGTSDSFLSMPRAAVVKSLEGRDDVISTDFTLDGNLDDPKFSIEQGLTAQIGLGIAAALGVSIIGVAAGVGKLGVQGAKAVGDAFSGDSKQPE